jgi:hypothetical protein
MYHINLKLTHRYLYRNILAIVIFSLFVGFGMLFSPQQFFNSPNYSGILGQLASAHTWGIMFVAAGVTILLGLYRFSYRFALVGLVIFASITTTWSIGLFLLPLVGVSASYTGACIYGLATVLAISSILESTINPTTAINRDEKGDDE